MGEPTKSSRRIGIGKQRELRGFRCGERFGKRSSRCLCSGGIGRVLNSYLLDLDLEDLFRLLASDFLCLAKESHQRKATRLIPDPARLRKLTSFRSDIHVA